MQLLTEPRDRAHWGPGGPATEDIVLSEQVTTGVMDTPRPATQDAKTALPYESSALHQLIFQSLDDDGTTDIVSIDLAGKSSEADTMIIASGRSTRHVTAVAEKLVDRLKHDAGIVPRAEGKAQADWVLIDAGDVIVHIFRPEVREFYQLEKMWLLPPDKTARTAEQR